MKNKKNKIFSGIKSNSFNIEKDVGDIQNVFIFCIFNLVKSSFPRIGYNAITLLSSRFPVVTSEIDSLRVIIVVSLFPDYFSRTYAVTDNSNIKVLNLVQFISHIDAYFTNSNFELCSNLYVFHGFR
jgi:hypothetical protein